MKARNREILKELFRVISRWASSAVGGAPTYAQTGDVSGMLRDLIGIMFLGTSRSTKWQDGTGNMSLEFCDSITERTVLAGIEASQRLARECRARECKKCRR